jgi:hypothetical protein
VSHQEAVREHYRQQGREQLLAYLIQKGIIRESMIGGYVAHLVETQPDDVWPRIDLPQDLTAWQPKKEEENDR